MHIYKSRILVRGEVWFDGEPDPTPVDWIHYQQRSRPVPGAQWKFFYTVLLDLSRSPELLQQQMHKNTAYKIRRARDKDRVACEAFKPVSRDLLDTFQDTYKRFAAIKDLAPLDRRYLDQLAKEGFLEVSLAKDPEGKPLAYHAYYRDANRSCLLHAASLYQLLSDSTARNAMGRANRYLFWSDILRHQEQGLRFFDFGGWYPGNSNAELLEINRFKEGFGGQVVREYNCQQILSLKGWVVLTIASWLSQAKSFPARLRFRQGAPQPQAGVTGAEPSSPGGPLVGDPSAVHEPELAQ